jgi:CDP-diacylglycerol---glycerol-3-phosphate 3-phosphatidyltransferase
MREARKLLRPAQRRQKSNSRGNELVRVLTIAGPRFTLMGIWSCSFPNPAKVPNALASIYGLKPRFQALLRPATNWLAAKRVTANQVTLAAAALSLFIGGVISVFPARRDVLLLVPITLLFRMALNAIDGMLAREHGMKSRLGAVLNELTDVLSDAALYLPLSLVDGICPALVVVFVILGIISEMAGVVAVQIGVDRRYDGPLGKSDRAVAISLICFLLGIGVAAGRWLTAAFTILIVLAIATIVRRSRNALRLIGGDSTFSP